MSFTMDQYNSALLDIIDKNKRHAIKILQKPTTAYKTEEFKNILYTLMAVPHLQDSRLVLDFLNRNMLGSDLAEATERLVDLMKVETGGKTDETNICRFQESLYSRDRFRLDGSDLDSFVRTHNDLLEAMIDTLEQDGWNVMPYDNDPGYIEIERWTDGTDCDMILGIDLRGKCLDSPIDWKDEVTALVNDWDVDEEAVLNHEAPGAPSLSEIIKDFRDFKDHELNRLAFITEKVADAWEKKSTRNEDFALRRESHDLSAKCSRVTDISHNFSTSPKDESLTHDGENTNR